MKDRRTALGTGRRWRYGHAPEGPTVRAALLVGFGVTFGIWLFAGYSFARRFGDVETRAATINARYTQAQELLSTVRTQVLLGSVYVRDAFLDPDPQSVSAYRQRLDETYGAVDAALGQYVPVLDSEAERARVEHLRREVADFRNTMAEALSADVTSPSAATRERLQRGVVPRREQVIRLADEAQALNRAAYVRQQTTISEMYSATQRRIWQMLGLALAASFGVGLLASMYAGRLESRLKQQLAKDAQNTSDLQRLSARLLTAQEEERRTIARELHDEVGQVLTAIKVELAVAQRAIDDVPGAHGLLDDARSIADGALATVRDLSHLLHPSLLDDLGLPSAIDWYLRGFAKRYSIRTQLLQDGMHERLTAEIETTAYRIVQEALTNVARHSSAAGCSVYLQRLGATILVTIEDDGIGIDEAATRSSAPVRGLGLIGIRERTADLGGTMRIESAQGRGTRVTVELPARPRQTGEATPSPMGLETLDDENAHPVG